MLIGSLEVLVIKEKQIAETMGKILDLRKLVYYDSFGNGLQACLPVVWLVI